MAAVVARRALSVAAPLGRALSTSASTAAAVTFRRPAHPLASGVLSLDTATKVPSAAGAGQVLVRMLAAPITPTDVWAISTGMGGTARSGVAGNEGVGIVQAVGDGVSGVANGDVVVASKPGAGTWATHVLSSPDYWTVVKGDAPGSATFPVESAAVSVASPTLARLLLSAAGLTKGDTLIQNNAGSTVGQAVIQYAAAAGVKTINILRKHNDWANMSHHLQGLGAGVVVDEDFARTPAFRKVLADMPAPKVGLNSVGGASASTVAKALAPGATLLTFGASSGGGLRLPSSLFTTRGLTVKGFSLADKLASLSKADRDALVRESVDHVRSGTIKQLVAREPWSDFSHALARSFERGERKVVLVFPQ